VDVSREEFDKRAARQDGLNSEIFGLQRGGYDERMAAERGYDATQAEARGTGLSLYEQALEALGVKRASAAEDANQAIEAYRQQQAGYRAQADTTVDQAIAQAGNSIADQEADAARRAALVASTITAPTAPLVTSGNAVIAADAARQTQEAVDRSRAEGTQAAKLASYSEVPRTFGRQAMTLGDALQGIDLQSGISRTKLASDLTIPRIQVVNATAGARSDIDFAQADMENKIKLGDMLRQGTIANSADYENAVVGAHQTYGQAQDDASRLFEQRMGVVSDNTMRSNIAGKTVYPNTTLGSLLTAAGNIGGAAARWGQTSGWFKPSEASAAMSGTNGGWYGGDANSPDWR
jgi:hypothetical protein